MSGGGGGQKAYKVIQLHVMLLLVLHRAVFDVPYYTACVGKRKTCASKLADSQRAA